MRARAGAVLAAFHEGAGAGIHEGVHEGACADIISSRRFIDVNLPLSFTTGSL